MPEDETAETSVSVRPPRRRRLRRWLVVAVVFVLGLLWLSGPGLRLIAPGIVMHYLKKAGIRGNFAVKGNLVGGLSFSDLKIESDGVLAAITVDRIRPDYRWRGLVRGEIEGLSIEGVHLDLNLDAKPSEPNKPLDLKKLVTTIRDIRARMVPLRIDINDLTLTATKGGKPALQLAKSRLHHEAGIANVDLELGSITDATGRAWPAQAAVISWTPDEISIARIDPLPGASLRDFVLQTPASGDPAADARIHIDNAVFVLSTAPGFTVANLDLREGSLDVAAFAKRFGVETPVTGTLVSFAVEAEHLFPDPARITASARLLIEDAAYLDWTTPQLSVDANLGETRADIAAQADLLGTGVSIDAIAPVTRDAKTFVLGNASGHFSIADVPAALRGLSPKVPALDPKADVPASSLDGSFDVLVSLNKLAGVAADFTLKPVDATLVSPVAIKATWSPDKPLTFETKLDGLTASGTWNIPAATYEAKAGFGNFTTARIDRWLTAVKVKLPGTVNLTGTWTGGGAVKNNKHRGDLTLASGSWIRPNAPLLTAGGGVRYDWPGGFETRQLRFEMSGQKVALDAAMASGLLELRKFLWTSGTTELAQGTASLPVPADFANWRDTIAHDPRPVVVNINSRVLALQSLRDWVPALGQFDPRSTGKLDVKISGTYAAPAIDAKLEARDLRSPLRPELPPADLQLVLTGRGGKLTLEGTATAPDFAPAEIKASLPFKPSEWAENPAAFLDEPVAARVDFPRLDLTRFASLIPDAVKITGVLTANAMVSGKIGKPDIKGAVDVTGGSLRFKDQRFPDIDAVALTAEAVPDRVLLKSLRATVAGGTLQGDGSLALVNGKPGEILMHARGNHLPIVRNELLIVRANADLNLRGTWDRATISGTAGTVDGIFYRDIEILPIGRPFTGPAAAELPKIDTPQNPGAAIPEPFRNWGLDVVVKTIEPVLIRGNLATGDISGSMRVGGTIGSPAPSGVFNIKDVRASLPFSTLTVRSGTATFVPAYGFDPVLELRGIAEPRPYVVNVYVYGRASDPQLVLTSTPPLPENEIMTLLATGTTTSGLEDPQAASSRALQLLIEELRRGRFRFGKQLRPVLALLDRVEFSLAEADPYSSESYSTATVSLTDRWYLSAGIGAEGGSRGLLIWRLSFR